MNTSVLASSTIIQTAPKPSTRNSLKWMAILLGVWLFPSVVPPPPAMGAERLEISYEILERSIPIDALEAFAKNGTIQDDLAPIVKYIKPEQMADIRNFLLIRSRISPVVVSQFLYTSQADALLQRLGEVIKTDNGEPGERAIRAALITAAASSEGLSLLNVLRKFPARSIRIDLARSLQIVDELSKIINKTNLAIAAVAQQSNLEAAKIPTTSLLPLPDLGRVGPFSWRKETLNLNDTSRNRTFKTDIYLPTATNTQQPKTPASVIVISHGLGEDNNTYAYLARHLASYGFVVAVPEHPGSSVQQIQDVMSGRANQVSDPTEFINRPLDIKYLLNELERLSQSEPLYSDRMNLQKVGFVGHSYGGYTGLVLAGAKLNFNQLQKDCQYLKNSWNASLLLQCRALELAPVQANLLGNYRALYDERVKAVMAINPVNSSILGQDQLSQIKIPVMFIGGSADTIAPALEEQIQPFTWLTTPEKYLVVIENSTHFSTEGEDEAYVNKPGVIQLPDFFLGPNRRLARRYTQTLSMAFFKTYINNQPGFRSYLSAAYGRIISQSTLPLRIVQSFKGSQLEAALERANAERNYRFRAK